VADISKLEQQADLLMQNVMGWENSTLQRIGKRIKKYGKLSLADVKSINNIAVVKSDMDAITKELAKVTGYNISQIEQMYGELLEEQHLANQPLYDYRGKTFVPFTENRELQAIARAYAKTTGETMINLAKTKALCVLGANGKPIGMQKYYTDVLDKAVMQVTTGATDFHTAMRDSIIELGGSGVRVDYGGGVTRRLDTVVRQNLLWGAKQASTEYNTMIGEELGCDGIEVDFHSNPRPSHEFMQGKQYVLGKARTINGIHFESADEALERLQDYGCLHYKTPIICGVSEPRYSPEELKRLNEQNAKRYTIDGKEYSGYEVTQMQRRLESSVRNEKTTRDLAKASGDNALVKRCNERIKAYQGKYNEISEITGIQGDKKRMWVGKGGNPKDLVGVKIKPPKEGVFGGDGKLFKVASPPQSSFEIPQKLKRPSRKDYVDEDKYLADKMKYRTAMDKYEENIDKIVAEQSNRKIKFETKGDFEVWAKDKGIYYESDVFEKIDGMAIGDFAEVTDEMFEKYPFLSGKTYSVSGETFKSKFRLSAKPSIDGCFMEANSGVAFNPTYFGDYKKALREALEQMSDGSLVVGDGTLKTAIRHEFGHNVESHIRLTHSPKEMVVFERELIDLAKTKGVSEYASTNSCELFAEGFAAFESGEKTEFAEAFGKLLERWLK
jgi:hypothetical protein